MAAEGQSPYIKEALGFSEGSDIEIYFVDEEGGEAEPVGQLRPDHAGPTPRLYERFDLQLSSPGQSVYFGQKDRAPFIIKMKKTGRGEYSGALETNLFLATANLSVYSPYSEDRFIFTLEVRKNDRHRRGPSDQILPSAWREKKEE